MIGMTIRVKTVEVRRPPMMTQAMETRDSEPGVMARAMGVMPTIMVMVVMKMGLRRTRPASMTASRALWPLSIKVSV